MKEKFKQISYIIIMILATFIVYKFTMLIKYKTENIDINKETIFNETLNIEYSKNDNAIEFDEMSYADYFSDYVEKDNTNFKVKYNENNEITSFYSIVKEKQYINLLNINSFEITEKENNYATEKSMKEFLNKNQIKNDIDLIKYIKDNYHLKNSILTNIKTMKNNYILNSFTEITLPEFESITLIKGDKIEGYIINTKNIKSIRILHNEDQYIITLSGNEIENTEFITDLLESISFKNK